MAFNFRKEAERVLKENWIEGKYLNFVHYAYTRPSIKGPFFYKTGYQQQWFWDSCFHVIMNAKYFDARKAKQELATLIRANRRKHVLIGMVSFWNVKMIDPVSKIFQRFATFKHRKISTRVTQPPMAAMALEAIYERTKDKVYLSAMLPRVADHYLYLKLIRDTDKNELIQILHPLESGTDARPDFFPALRIHAFRRFLSPLRFAIKSLFVGIRYYLLGSKEAAVLQESGWRASFLKFVLAGFNFEDPMFNAIYVQNLRALSRLFKEIGEDRLASLHAEQADKTEAAIFSKLWDGQDKVFYGLFGKHGRKARVKTIASLMPLMLDNLPKHYADELVKHLSEPTEFATAFPIPTCAVNDPAFQPKESFLVQLWRGPAWISTNWFIYNGLVKHGYMKEAKELGKRTIKLIELSGFREYYNPLTGEGYGAYDFGWSTLAYDIYEDYRKRFRKQKKTANISTPKRTKVRRK